MKTSVKSKKQIALLSAGALLSMAVAGTVGAMAFRTASAQTISSSDTSDKTLELTYMQQSTWTVTLPDSITMGTAAEVSASGNMAEGETLTVTVKGTDESAWKLTEDAGSKTIEYKLRKGDSAENVETDVDVNGEVLKVAGIDGEQTASGKAYIKAEVEGSKSTGGKTYKDTLTFHVDVK